MEPAKVQGQKLTIYAGPREVARIRKNNHNFFCRTIQLFESSGWTTETVEDDILSFAQATIKPGYSLFYRSPPPPIANALVCRRSYIGAFWQIEKSPFRWEWPVTKKKFDPSDIDKAAANRFFRFWKNRLFPKAPAPTDEGFVLAPLQGRLHEHRSFQAASPLEMLEQTLEMTGLPVIATLHPRARLSERDSKDLEDLARKHSRLTIRSGGSMDLLPKCNFVVSQYSGVVLEGYFFEKPAVLFAEIDFHHIAGSVMRQGIDQAFASVRQKRDYARYLYWFLKLNSLNAGNESFEENLLAKFRSHGWPI